MEDKTNISLFWDAGDLGCGELIMELAKKIKVLNSGDLFEVIALDKGRIEDLPSWARMTGNELIKNEPPSYIFKKK